MSTPLHSTGTPGNPVKTPAPESWLIHRAGVINFWYYDEETFHFENGRLLLRGANGSGKSVTMQSLVPLLFDGNKSPERLDPFGSKARRMESYLLSDGLDLEERTGYLFLEFTKPAAGRYLTLGMGMRARRNAPLQTWYFLVLDNRRLGSGHDLSLYKDLGDKIPLTQKELENRLGSGNLLFTRQRDYKAAVNEHLFGYKDLSDFDELIELLIQIRSPKLSKEFKPTTMYEIMQNSLVTLTDEDLRPMSEAIENMDEIQLKIDALKASHKALGRIQHHYDKYNQHLLAAKAQRFLKALEEENHNQQHHQQLEKQRRENESRQETLHHQQQENRHQQDSQEQLLASLQDHDLNRLSQENTTLTTHITEKQGQLQQKEARLEETKSQEHQLTAQQRREENALYQGKKAIAESLEDLASLEDDTAFDEHAFFAADYEKQTPAPYQATSGDPGTDAKGEADPATDTAVDQTFQHHRQAIGRYTRQVKEGFTLLQQQDQATTAYEASLAEAEAATRRREQQDREVSATEGQMNQVKEEFAEAVFTWHGQLKGLTMERSVLHLVTERAFQYGEPHRFDQILEPARLAFQAAHGQGVTEKSLLQSRHTQHQQQLQEALETLKALKAQKEPTPTRTAAVTANRQRLTQQQIPHQPLYRVLDFDPQFPEDLRGSLEEALDSLGLLDALVVDPQHRETVLAMDPGHSDRYLFAQPALLSHNLSACLTPDTQAPAPHLVQEILQSILLDPEDHRFHLSPETGLYGTGPLVGKTSRTAPSRFIGAASRRRYLQEQIDAQAQVVHTLREEEVQLKNQLAAMEDHLSLMKEEWGQFPTDDNLAVAHEDRITARRRQQDLAEQEQRLKTVSESHYQKLKTLQAQVSQSLSRLSLPRTTQAYETALEAMEAYRQHFDALTRHHLQCRHHRQQLHLLARQLEDCRNRQDDLRDDLFQLEKQLRQHQERRQAIEAQLATADFQAIHQQLTACREALKTLPQEYQRLSDDLAAAKATGHQLHQELETLLSRQHTFTRRRQLYETAFAAEWRLGYVDTPETTEESGSPEVPHEPLAADSPDPEAGTNMAATAKHLLQMWSNVLEEGKTVFSRRESVTAALLKEQGELAEYHLQGSLLFQQEDPREEQEQVLSEEERSFLERIDLTARVQGRTIHFYQLSQWIQAQMKEQAQLLSEQDRELFEEILIKSVSRKINAKIYHSEGWVKKIDTLMSHMDTSMGLTFHLKWVTRQAETEDQLSTRELVDLLRGDQSLLTREQKDRLIRHFRSKIREAKVRSEEKGDPRGFLSLMREVLDYRKWFEFQLSYTKKGEKRKELTNNAFFTFSGGEKAMAMYVPLFSAVYAKYQGGAMDCPKVISLDEAFAGVDEKNIRDMFRLLVQELELSFIANSQVLYGDYDTVPQLAVYELIRPENVTFVTTLRYRWNGHQRLLVQPEAAAANAPT